MNRFFFIICMIISSKMSAQVVCLYCYDQNDRISGTVNNLILNGSFENTDCGSGEYYCPNATFYACNLNNWTCTGGGPSTYAQVLGNSITVVPDGSNTAYLGNYFCNPCSTTTDDISCITDQDCQISGIPANYPTNTSEFGNSTGVSIQQTVGGLTIGSIYVLEFWVGGESGFTVDGVFGLDVGFGNFMLANNVTPPSSMGKRYIVEFKAAAASHTIKFTNWGHICSSCTEAIIDDVRLYPVSDVSSTVPVCDSNNVVTPPPGPGVILTESLFIPNVFTPNGQEGNEEFTITYIGEETYELSILNRWGSEVFHSTDKNTHWNGTIDGKDADEGVYFYKLSIGSEVHHGFLTLVR